MEFPVLETERIILRQLTPADSEDVFEYFSQDHVMEYYDLEAFRSLDDARNIIEHFNSEFEKGKFVDAKVFGLINKQRLEARRRKLEVTIYR